MGRIDRAWRRASGLALMWVLCAAAGAQAAAPSLVDEASPEVVQAVQHIRATGDAGRRPFAIVDKRQARVFVFGGDGRLVGADAALLGSAPGDDTVPGVGQLAGRFIPPSWRTTPAGRFASEPGLNDKGEAIVWVDYDAAVAIHRLRPAPAGQHRPQRLMSHTPDDNRITLGCIVVSSRFYDDVVAPTLGTRRGVVYVLPEARSWQGLFPAREASAL